MIDNSRSLGLQAMYHAGASGALNPLAEECTRIAFILVKTICKKKGLRFSRDRMEEIAHDSAALVISRYLKDPNYRVKKFYSVVWDALQCVMFDGHRRKQKCFEDAQVTLPVEKNVVIGDFRQVVNPASALDELVADHPSGKRIAIDLARAKSYSKAIRRIAAYVERDWIYNNAERIHTVFKTMRWRPSTKSNISGNGSGRVRNQVLQDEQTEPKQPIQRSGTLFER